MLENAIVDHAYTSNGDGYETEMLSKDGMNEMAYILAKVHTKVVRGEIADALYDLEKVLSFLDSGWGCRS